MNRLAPKRKAAAEVLLEMGHSTRSVERLIGVNKNTVAKLVRKPNHKLGRPVLGEKAKTKILPIRVTKAEYDTLTNAAKNCKSLSSWIRRELLKAAKVNSNDQTNHQSPTLLQV